MLNSFMRFGRAAKIAILAVAVATIAIFAFRVVRGPSGASRDYGGRLEPVAVADFPSRDPERWVNGAPPSASELRAGVLLIEAWHPD
jgi:hypothetical protein